MFENSVNSFVRLKLSLSSLCFFSAENGSSFLFIDYSTFSLLALYKEVVCIVFIMNWHRDNNNDKKKSRVMPSHPQWKDNSIWISIQFRGLVIHFWCFRIIDVLSVEIIGSVFIWLKKVTGRIRYNNNPLNFRLSHWKESRRCEKW